MKRRHFLFKSIQLGHLAICGFRAEFTNDLAGAHSDDSFVTAKPLRKSKRAMSEISVDESATRKKDVLPSTKQSKNTTQSKSATSGSSTKKKNEVTADSTFDDALQQGSTAPRRQNKKPAPRMSTAGFPPEDRSASGVTSKSTGVTTRHTAKTSPAVHKKRA